MKKTIMFLGVLSLGLAHAQQGRVGINTDEPKATLQVKSTSPDEAKGVLIPQMTGDEIKTMTNTLTTDQHGLITFTTNGVTTLDNLPTNNVQFAGYHRFNMVGQDKSWVRLEPSGLEKIKGEGINSGWALVGRDATKYGAIGLNSVDISAVNSNATAGVVMGATGNHSFATGLNTSASGWNSTTFGNVTIASGNGSIAMGSSTTASGSFSLAAGNGSQATGWNSTAIGNKAIASGSTAFALGTSTIASNNNAFAAGNESQATGWNSTAIGNKAIASGGSAFALGTSTRASETNAFAAGNESQATGWNSVAIGNKVVASGSAAIALGQQSVAKQNYSFATGNHSKANGLASIAIGFSTVAEQEQEMAIGMYNTIQTDISTLPDWHSARLLVVGNGSGNYEDVAEVRSDALTILRNGKVGVGINNFEIAAQPSNAKLQVNGSVKLGSNTNTCNTDNAGTIRFDATAKKFQGCTGTEWKDLHN